MAKRASTKTTDQYTHPSAKRANLPTEQTGKTMSDTDRQPILHIPETRDVDDEPILAWNRQPANENGHAAHPLYVREKVHPAAFVKLLQGSGEQPQLFSRLQRTALPRRRLRVVPALSQLVQPAHPRREHPSHGLPTRTREHGWQSPDDLL